MGNIDHESALLVGHRAAILLSINATPFDVIWCKNKYLTQSNVAIMPIISPSVFLENKVFASDDCAYLLSDRPSAALRFDQCPPFKFKSARQLLIFENARSFSIASQRKGIVLVELVDGRVFFLRTSLAVITDDLALSSLLDELRKLPEWIADCTVAAQIIGYEIGAPLEFIDIAPSKLDGWDIHEWKNQAALRIAVSQPMMTIQQINIIATEQSIELTRTLSNRIDDFIAALDQFSSTVDDKYSQYWQFAYNYFSHSCEPQRTYRRQAGVIFPLLVQQLFVTPKENWVASIIQAIDNGVPLVDHIAILFNSSKKCVRHLNGLRFEDIGAQWAGRIKELLTIMSSLDVNRLPRGAQEWMMFGESINLLSVMTRMPPTSLSNRLLLGELSRLNWRNKLDSSISYHERAQAIEQFSDHIREAIIATAWVSGQAVCITDGLAQRLAFEVACSLGLSRLERLARKWRVELIRLESEVVAQQKNGFPIVLESPLEVGDLKVIQLTNSTQLSHEGRCMSNCVGRYSGECASGRAFIFSVRDMTGNSCVTVEYVLKRTAQGLHEFRLVQQQGRENTRPDRRFHAALDVLKRYTKSPHVRKKLPGLIAYQKAVENGCSDIARKHVRHMHFTQFLEKEYAGKFDFKKLVEAAVTEQTSVKLLAYKHKNGLSRKAEQWFYSVTKPNNDFIQSLCYQF
ncbi:MAG: PcfJ domain-containing protein [Gallionella sp.]